MRKRIIALALATAMFISLFPAQSIAAPVFSDLSGHWSEDVITALARQGVVNGFPDGTVRPDATMSRGEYACLVANLMDMQDHIHGGDPSFSDTHETWAHHYIEALVATGIIQRETDSFNPNEPITRVEMARMLVYALGLGDSSSIETALTTFADDEDIRPEDKGFISAAKEYGLINGRPDNVFAPNDHSTRAEAFVIISRFESAMLLVSGDTSGSSSGSTESETPVPILKPDKTDNGSAIPIINLYKSGSSQSASGGSGNTTNSNSGTSKPAPAPSTPVFPSQPETTPAPSLPSPLPEIDIGLPATVDTDDDGNLVLDLTGTEGMEIEWSLTYNDDPVEISEHIEGELTLVGGAIRFKYKGVYVLTAKITDSKGNKYTISSTIIYYPVPVIGISMPTYAYSDSTVVIDTTLTNMDGLDIIWTLMRDGSPVIFTNYTEGTLSNSGGTIRFTADGNYTLIATVTDGIDRTLTFSTEVTIYETMNFVLDFPNTIYAGGTTPHIITLSNPGNLSVIWKLTYNGGDVALSDYIEGSISNTGGSIKFKQKGEYTLTATITDQLGREYTATASATVYPVPKAEFSLPAALYTDDTYALVTELEEMEGLNIIWSLRRNNTDVALPDYITGTLSNDGGSIRFTADGEYILTASVTDGADRTFTTTGSVKIYEVLDFDFTLPDTGYAGEDGTFDIIIDNPDDLPVEWELARDGDEVELSDYIDGELGNTGGSIKFKQKGTYVLKAKIKDKNGREYEVSSTITVYPTPGVMFGLPSTLYTDDTYSLVTELEEMEGLVIIWSLKRNNSSVTLTDYIDGTLTNSGGSIKFTQEGNYQLTASFTDDQDRTFEKSTSVTVYPVIELSFSLPDAAHTDTVIDLDASNNSNIGSVWSLTHNGTSAELTDCIEGSLSDEDGTLRFKQPGTYVITMSVTDENDRTFTASEAIEVYPVLELTLSMPSVLHTDDVCEVILTGAEGLDVEWNLNRGGNNVELLNYIDGSLTDSGGSIQFTREGNYELTAAVTDNANRLYSAAKTATIYAVPDMTFNVSGIGYVNIPIPITTCFTDLYESADWSLKYEGGPVQLSDYTTGTLSNSGGSLAFTRTGSYELTAAFTDNTGRTFSKSNNINISVELNCNFNIPATNQHISKNFTVAMDASASLGGKTISWSLTRSGVDANYTGTLNNSGGSIKVTVTGTYTLTASIVDGLGRTITCSKNFTVYNNTPSTPSISRTPSTSMVSPKQAVKITASGSSDPDGDSVTYIWENRPSESYYYGEGSYTVRVKARDAYGAESGWASTSFTSELRTESGSFLASYNSSDTVISAPSGKYMKSVTISSNSFHGKSDSYYSVTIQWFNSTTQQWEVSTIDLTSQTSGTISTADKKYTSVKIKFVTGNMNPGGAVYYDIEYFYP